MAAGPNAVPSLVSPDIMPANALSAVLSRPPLKTESLLSLRTPSHLTIGAARRRRCKD